MVRTRSVVPSRRGRGLKCVSQRLHAVGKILGGVLGIFGWLVLAGLAATVFGFGLFMFAIILIVGVIALIISVMT